MNASARVISVAIAVMALLAVTPASGASSHPDDDQAAETAPSGSTSISGTSTRITWISEARDRLLVISWCSRTDSDRPG